MESPYNAPKSDLLESTDVEILAYKKYVLYQDGSRWPARCYKCNQPTDGKKLVKLTYVNPWIYLSILITPILTIILALIFQKKFSLDMPICEAHKQKRKRFLIFQWSMIALATVFFGVAVGANSGLAAGLAGLFLLLVVIAGIGGRLLYAAKLKNGYYWLRGAGKEFVADLRVYKS